MVKLIAETTPLLTSGLHRC